MKKGQRTYAYDIRDTRSSFLDTEEEEIYGTFTFPEKILLAKDWKLYRNIADTEPFFTTTKTEEAFVLKREDDDEYLYTYILIDVNGKATTAWIKEPIPFVELDNVTVTASRGSLPDIKNVIGFTSLNLFGTPFNARVVYESTFEKNGESRQAAGIELYYAGKSGYSNSSPARLLTD